MKKQEEEKTTEGGDPQNEAEEEAGDGQDDGFAPEESNDFSKEELQCRFYRNEWPEKDELVMVQINEVNEDGAYVSLLEYDNREALILASSVTRKRVKNVKRHLKMGTLDCMQVISIDKEGEFIDLSKKTVQVQDFETKKKYYDKSKIVHLILRLTAHQLKVKLIDLYEKFGWDFYDKFGLEHAYDAFKLCLTDPDVVLGKLNISKPEREALLANIQKKMAAAPVKLRSIFNLKCYTFEGIDAIRESLLQAKEKTSDKEFELVFQLIAPPQYMVEVVTLDKAGATARLDQALQMVSKEITQRGGTFRKVQGPILIGTNKNYQDDDGLLSKIKGLDSEHGSTDEDNDEGIDVNLDGDDLSGEDA